MLDEMKQRVFKANMLLKQNNLIKLTWGNVSEIDRGSGLVAIKPSGMRYESMSADDIVIVDLDGNVVDGHRNPSSDTPTHLYLYKAFADIGGITHTHSTWATAFAQAGRDIPILGTTHADTFYGDIPCTRQMKENEIKGDYERETGAVIAERFKDIDSTAVPAVLVASHGPFTWGKDAYGSVENAIILEEVAKLAWLTEGLKPQIKFDSLLADKHYLRKHGSGAYYGQKGENK